MDRFELAFVGAGGIACEAIELGDPAMEIGEADAERIRVGIFIGERDGNIFGVVPIEFSGMRAAPQFAAILVLSFLRVVFVPFGNFNHEIHRAIGHALAAKTRLRREARASSS